MDGCPSSWRPFSHRSLGCGGPDAIRINQNQCVDGVRLQELDTCDMEVDLTENLTEMHSERRRYAAERKNSEQLGQVEWLTNTSTSLSV